MELIFRIENENYKKVRELLLKDEIASKASLTFREGNEFGVEGYVCLVSGPEEYCKRVKELIKDFATEIEDEEIIKKIREKEKVAIEGLGNLF